MIDVDNLEKSLGMRVAQLRTAKGVSARDMSLSIGQGAAYIHNIENRKTMPSMRGFLYICEYLNISPKDFFDMDSADPEKLNEIIKDMKALTPEQLSNIANIVKDIKK
ncbi:MAG: helix-turn-helix domain-containing protein [Oscillospiraceae bacterium]|nr:helix-turn-helix domain-containing protein [Oscillospiraceae bacterium]